MRIVDLIGKGNEFISAAGDRYHEQFVGKLEKDGTISLHSVGTIDIQNEIDSYELETDINVLIKRVENGDLSAFVNNAVYADFTELPMHPAEMMNLVMDAERDFNRLPVNVKEKFDFDFKKYFAQAGTESWIKNIIGEKEEVKEEVKEDVKEQ